MSASTSRNSAQALADWLDSFLKREPDSNDVLDMTLDKLMALHAYATVATTAAATHSEKKDNSDTDRLDWLDRMNLALNKQYGTQYGWKVILSPNVVRLMMQSPFVTEMALIDLNDTDGGQYRYTSVRAALDEAMGSYRQESQPE